MDDFDDKVLVPYQRHAFVCTFGPWCKEQGAEGVHKAMKSAVKEAGLARDVRVNKSGCLNQCGHGPVAVVYPDSVWYAGLDVAKGLRVVREHLVEGKPCEDLRFRPPQPGANKTAAVREAEAKGVKAD